MIRQYKVNEEVNAMDKFGGNVHFVPMHQLLD